MFQSFDEVTSPGAAPERVKALRRALKSSGLDGFFVPHSDEHQDEFLPPFAERLRWLTGFTGSAGAAVVLADEAALFVDGRYTLQARAQVDPSLFQVLQTPGAKVSSWIKSRLEAGGGIGYDPGLHTVKEIDRLTETLGRAGIKLIPQATNPIDVLWQDRPAPPSAPVVPQSLEFAGKSAKDKIAELRETLAKDKADAVLRSGGMLLLAVFLLHTGGFALSWLFAYAVGYGETIRRTISIEVGMQNSGLGAALAKNNFPSMPLAPAPCAISAVFHSVIGSLLAGIWRLRPPKE